MTREDHERTTRQAQTKGAAQPTVATAQSQSMAMPQPGQVFGPDTYRRGGDYTHGHPGLPPKGYKQPREGGIFGRHS